MTKLRPALTVYGEVSPGLRKAKFPYHPDTVDAFKRLPGCRYAPKQGKGVWLVPWNAQEALTRTAAECGLIVVDKVVSQDSDTLWIPPNTLHDYQQTAVQNALSNRAYMFAFEMGLGKTATAIIATQGSLPKRVLVVCPAVARTVWKDELDKWWPEHPETYQLTKGAAIDETLGVPIVITSYGLMKHVAEQQFDVIIFDESHYLSNGRSGRTKTAYMLRKNNLDARVLLLTGTPITDQPKGLWAQLNIMYPESFGTFWRFQYRYCDKTQSQYAQSGFIFHGRAEETSDELRSRLHDMCSRVTKSEVAHLLPPLSVQTIRLERESQNNFDVWDDQQCLHDTRYDTFLHLVGNQKVNAALEWAASATQSVSHAAILTHRVGTAVEIADQLKSKGHNVLCVTGQHFPSPEKRNEALKELARAEAGIVVATMHSVGIAIDLTFCSQALFAELYYQPATMLQALSRFYRLNSKSNVSITFLVLTGSVDELIVSALRTKIDDMNSLIKAGAAENKLSEAITASEEDDDDFTARMRAIADNQLGDEYL